MLAKALKINRLNPNKRYKLIYNGSTFINWGCSSVPGLLSKGKIVNKPEAIALAANKLKFFQAVDSLHLTVPWTTSRNKAEEWIGEGYSVVCRTKLSGHSGEGIVIARASNELVDCALYTKYIKKETEWRVHVFQGEVIDIQRKARDRDIPDSDVNWAVRSHNNGFVYIRGDLKNYNERNIEENLIQPALKVINHIGLDFGAVDIICNSKRSYVLEVNSAPGLEGTTLDNYVKAFRRLI